MRAIKTIVSSAGLVLALATAASAHVTLEGKQAKPGSSYKAVLAVPHGCAKSATIRVTVTVPDGVIAVKPMPKAGWTVDTISAKYKQTYTFMHGITYSEGVREITWKGGRLEDANYDEFVFSSFIADALSPGTTLHFPVVQECEKGTETWTEIASAGQDAHALKSPAPSLTLVASTNATTTRFQIGPIVVEEPWLRATPAGAQVAGGYLKVTNTGATPDRLIGGTLERTRRFEIHEMTMDKDVMRMRPVRDGLVLKPNESVTLQPGGYHIMGLELQGQLRAGETVRGTLRFEKAGTLDVEYTVRPIGAGSGGEHKH